ncbi:MAG: hypothetical protein H6679_05120 [Epsilonproteobacteria bacterium]|nr:hypothetical protein [Campylobacterota bacterium]
MNVCQKVFLMMALIGNLRVYGLIVEVDVLSGPGDQTIHVLAVDGQDFSQQERATLQEVQMDVLRVQQQQDDDMAWLALDWRGIYDFQQAREISGGMGALLYEEWARRDARLENVECRYWLLGYQDFFTPIPPLWGLPPEGVQEGRTLNVYDITWDKLFEEYNKLRCAIIERASRLGLTVIDEALYELRDLYNELKELKGECDGSTSLLKLATDCFISELKKQQGNDYDRSKFVVEALENAVNNFMQIYPTMSNESWQGFTHWQQSRLKLLQEGYGIDFEAFGYTKKYAQVSEVIERMGDLFYTLSVLLSIFETNDVSRIVVVIEIYQLDLLKKLLLPCGYRSIFTRPDCDSKARFVGTRDLEEAFCQKLSGGRQTSIAVGDTFSPGCSEEKGAGLSSFSNDP